MRTSETELREWFVNKLSEMLMLPISEISLESNLYEMGVDSQDTMALIDELNTEFNKDLPFSTFNNNISINDLASVVLASSAKVA